MLESRMTRPDFDKLAPELLEFLRDEHADLTDAASALAGDVSRTRDRIHLVGAAREARELADRLATFSVRFRHARSIMNSRPVPDGSNGIVVLRKDRTQHARQHITDVNQFPPPPEAA